MKNVIMEREGDLLIVKINLKERHGRSKSGKTEIVASTEGNVTIKGTTIKIGINAYEAP